MNYKSGWLILDANVAGKLPIVLGGYVKTLKDAAEVRCMDGMGTVLGTLPTRAGLPADWSYRVEDGTRYAHYAFPGLTIIIR